MKEPVRDDVPAGVAVALLDWFDRHGRHDLPWQHPRTPYRVWVAEVMLQQTQVTTVIGYFDSFIARFPDVEALASADEDAVMAEWAGLGYYARARNLHATARRIVSDYSGGFPRDPEILVQLPGIGRSTANAIVAQAFDIRAPILDGNAKRVLARLAGVTLTPGTAAFEKRLWALSERCTPQERAADYTQAIMDLGATCCTRRAPSCGDCPLASHCAARANGTQEQIPVPRRKKKRPHRHTTMLVIIDAEGNVLFEKRPPAGIWGGLWSLPETDEPDARIETVCRQRFGLIVTPLRPLEPVEHAFTHFQLTIHALLVRHEATTRIMEGNFSWYARGDYPGVPTPVTRILNAIQHQPKS